MYKTQENIAKFYDSVEMPGGYAHNIVETLKDIERYYNGEFKTGKYDQNGLRKFFYNIVKPTCDVATKFIDLDTKDIVLKSEHSDDEYRVWLMQKELRQWLKNERFGVTLNELAAQYPKYGHLIVKKSADGDEEPVNILNCRFDPSSSSQETDEFFYELHRMSKSEIDEMPWDKDAVQELYDKYPNDSIFDIYECYDYQDGGWKLSIKAACLSYLESGQVHRGTEADLNVTDRSWVAPICLFGGEEGVSVKETPYRELKWDDVPGRRLGMGFVEYLFDNQVAINDQEYIKRKALVFSGLVAFQTADDQIGNNILTDVQNGEIIKSKEGVNRLDTRLQDLQHFQMSEARWDSNTERKTFTFDAARGENQPSGTPLGIANLNAAQVASYFEGKREKYGHLVKDIILNDVLPNFKKWSRKKHIYTFLGTDSEIEKLDKAIVESLVNQSAFDYAMKTGFMPSADLMAREKDRAMNALRSKKNRYLEIPDGFYDGAKYAFDVLVTGEQINSNTSNILQVALQLLGTNPALTQNKGTRTIFFKLLELGGLSPVDLNLMEQEMRENPMLPEQMMAPGAPTAAPQQGMGNAMMGAIQ